MRSSYWRKHRDEEKTVPARLIALAFLTVSVALALAAQSQDRYTLKVPGGLAFSEFRGYESWQLISISQDGALVRQSSGIR